MSERDDTWQVVPSVGSDDMRAVEAGAGHQADLWVPNELHQYGPAIWDRRVPAAVEQTAVGADAGHQAEL